MKLNILFFASVLAASALAAPLNGATNDVELSKKAIPADVKAASVYQPPRGPSLYRRATEEVEAASVYHPPRGPSPYRR